MTKRLILKPIKPSDVSKGQHLQKERTTLAVMKLLGRNISIMIRVVQSIYRGVDYIIKVLLDGTHRKIRLTVNIIECLLCSFGEFVYFVTCTYRERILLCLNVLHVNLKYRDSKTK